MKRIYATVTSREFFLYLVNGGATALVYAVCSAGLVSLTQLPIASAILISNITASTFHFFGSHFVFKMPIKTIGGNRVIRYVLAVLINWGLTVLCGIAIAHLSGNKLVGALLAPIFPTLINYPLLKIFVFRKA